MASFREVIEGLQILSKYTNAPPGVPDGDGLDAHLDGAGHDIIGAADVQVSKEDEKRLEELGWHYDSEWLTWCRFV